MLTTDGIELPDSTHAGQFGDRYNRMHLPRYNWLLSFLEPYVTVGQSLMLDIGRSRLTQMLFQRFSTRVDTLGFAVDEQHTTGRHYRFDLNDAQDPALWRRDLPQYDVIVMAEVIEHLYTSPSLVLSFVRILMKPGGVLIVQTPNAVALRKRVELMLGRNPYELIRNDRTNPGHYREYTEEELRRYGALVGLTVEDCVRSIYMDYRYRKTRRASEGGVPLGTALAGTAANVIYRLVPSSLKPNMTLVLRKPG